MFAVMTVGKVSARATARNAHEARNLAMIACQGVIGMVSSSSSVPERRSSAHSRMPTAGTRTRYSQGCQPKRSEEHTSELQSRRDVVCRLLLEKKKINPKDFNAFNFRGKAYVAKGDSNQSITDFTQAIQFDPSYVEAYNNRGLSCEALGRGAEALADFRKAQSIDSADRISKQQLRMLGF